MRVVTSLVKQSMQKEDAREATKRFVQLVLMPLAYFNDFI